MSFPPWTPTTRHDLYPAIDPSLPSLSMAGKVVIITGGGSGIGKATALAFAKAHAKAVVITGRNETPLKSVAQEVKLLGVESAHFAADILDAARMQEVFKMVISTFGSIDIVISNAGYLSNPASIRTTDIDDWWKAFEVNTKGSFIVTQAFVQHASPSATIVNISSALAHTYFPDFSSYGASKLATVKILQDIHLEHPEFRTFSIQPGLIDTATSSKSSVPAQDTVDLPASVCVWLATDQADFLRGRMIWANWDVDELTAKRDEIVGNDQLKMVLKGWP